MSAAGVRLVLTDIDGTILPRGEQVVPGRTRAAFRAAQAAGVRVGPASGRGIGYVRAAFGGDDACVATALATNGMQAYLDGQLVEERHLDRSALAALEGAVRREGRAGMIAFEGDVPHLVCGDPALLERSFPRYATTAVRDGAVPEGPIVKCNLFCEPDLAETRSLVGRVAPRAPGLGLNVPLAGFVNVVPAGWSKASGVDVLCARLGIGLDQVVCFGDAGNDVEMLAHVPNSAAVAGASPEAAAAARWRVGRCEDHAVAEAIERIAAGEWPFGQGASQPGGRLPERGAPT